MRKRLRSEIGNDFILGMARFNWKFRRVFAILGIIAMLGSLLPNIQKTYAYPVSEVDTTQPLPTPEDVLTTSDEDFDISNIELIGEEESLRTADSKTFQRVDGSYVIALYSQNVHYMKDGKWEDINNRLTFNDKTDEYSNIDNQFSIKFPKSLDENKSIKMTMNDYSISWSIIGITKSDIVTTNEEIKTNNMKELTGVTQSVQYLDVTSDVDVEYIINGSNIKENIIIDNYIKHFSMTFEYEVKNLTLVEKDGNYSFINGDGDTVFDFASLFAVDQLGEVTEQISFSVTSVKKDIYQITVSLDNDWAAKASYPVTIDPSIKLSTTSSIHDTYLKENIESSYYTST